MLLKQLTRRSRSLTANQVNCRVCSACGLWYEHYGQRHKLCRPCKRLYDREYHAKRTAEAKRLKQDKQVALQQQKAKYVYDYLATHPCEVCGESDPVVLEFDHLDRGEKSFCISVSRMFSFEKIDEEIAKCRVLCANCHRRHTAKQLGYYQYCS